MSFFLTIDPVCNCYTQFSSKKLPLLHVCDSARKCLLYLSLLPSLYHRLLHLETNHSLLSKISTYSIQKGCISWDNSIRRLQSLLVRIAALVALSPLSSRGKAQLSLLT